MFHFDIPGEPIPWSVAKGKNGNLYNPRKVAKEKVRWLIRSHYAEEPLSGAIKLDFTFYVGVPQSVSLNKRRRMLAHLITPIVKPDTTNLVKFYEDCLSGILFLDDCQVTDTTAQKRYSENPRVLIGVTLLTAPNGHSVDPEPRKETAKLARGKVTPLYASEFSLL